MSKPAELTVKQQTFAKCLAFGSNQTEAYKTAYDCRGFSDAGVRVQACRLAKKEKIRAEVARLRKMYVKQKHITAEVPDEWVVVRLKDHATSPYASVRMRLRALELLTKLS